MQGWAKPVRMCVVTLEQVRAEALKLSEADQARLVDELLIRLHGPLDPDVAEAWYDEVERRLEAFDRGEVQGVPAEQVFRKLRERSRRRQQRGEGESRRR